MNRWIGIGRLTADPMISTKDDLMIARYNVAIDRPGKDKGTDFISCVVFGKCAEFAEKYLCKGTKIAIEGHIQTGSYTNKDGNKVYTTDAVVEKQEFVEAKKVSAEEPKGFVDVPAEEELPFM